MTETKEINNIDQSIVDCLIDGGKIERDGIQDNMFVNWDLEIGGVLTNQLLHR